ncbi:MAG: hypothetical protein FWH40_07040 [Coriobacteriia bacterium]|nr:hypothetical protein [Coriobacteriia bacterium]
MVEKIDVSPEAFLREAERLDQAIAEFKGFAIAFPREATDRLGDSNADFTYMLKMA